MRKLKDLLRLKFKAGLSTTRDIARSLSISPSSVSILTRQALAASDRPLPVDQSEAEIETRVFVSPEPVAVPRKTEPGYAGLHQELKRKGVTLQPL